MCKTAWNPFPGPIGFLFLEMGAVGSSAAGGAPRRRSNLSDHISTKFSSACSERFPTCFIRYVRQTVADRRSSSCCSRDRASQPSPFHQMSACSIAAHPFVPRLGRRTRPARFNATSRASSEVSFRMLSSLGIFISHCKPDLLFTIVVRMIVVEGTIVAGCTDN